MLNTSIFIANNYRLFILRSKINFTNFKDKIIRNVH